MASRLDAAMPPSDLAAEAAVLSAAMLTAAAMDRAALLLQPEQFYSEAHRRIFEACLSLYRESQPVDVVQVCTRLEAMGRLEQVGGFPYVTEVVTAAPAVVNVEAYATTVSHKYQLRQLIQTCKRIAAEAYAGVEDVSQFVDAAEQSIYQIARSAADRPKLEPIGVPVAAEFDRWEEIDRRRQAGELVPVSGIPTGLTELDLVLSGLHEGELTVIASRPGMGKTSLAVDVACNVARATEGGERPYAAAMFSLEMPKEQIADRAICALAEVDLNVARRAAFTPSDWSRVVSSVNELSRLTQFVINDTPALSLTAIRSLLRDAASDFARRGKRLRLAVVDYMQLMTAEVKHDSREQAVASLSRGLKALAKEMRISVVTLSQLNRGVEQRADKRPNLSDLRESGQIEQDADNVVFVYRDEYYNKETKEPGIAELIVEKQRNGPTGTVRVGFRAQFTKFVNLATEYPQ